MKSVIAQAHRVVVKVGSSLVTNDGRGLDLTAISLAEDPKLAAFSGHVDDSGEGLDDGGVFFGLLGFKLGFNFLEFFRHELIGLAIERARYEQGANHRSNQNQDQTQHQQDHFD